MFMCDGQGGGARGTGAAAAQLEIEKKKRAAAARRETREAHAPPLFLFWLSLVRVRAPHTWHEGRQAGVVGLSCVSGVMRDWQTLVEFLVMEDHLLTY
jgi:hypothetical protein